MMFLIGGGLSIATFVFFVPLHIKVIKKRMISKKKQFLVSILLMVTLALFSKITYYWITAIFNWG